MDFQKVVLGGSGKTGPVFASGVWRPAFQRGGLSPRVLLSMERLNRAKPRRGMVRDTGFEPVSNQTQPAEIQQVNQSSLCVCTQRRAQGIERAELFELIQAWPALGSALRQAVLAIVRTAVPERRQNQSGGAA